MKPWQAMVLALVVAGSCRAAPGSARAAAEHFLDAHYIRIDLDRSRTLCTGLARSKVDKEIELTSEVEIDGATRQPRVSYRLEEERPGDARVQYVYELTIRADGFDPFSRYVLLTVRDGDDGWSVTNYGEHDARPAS